MFSISQTPASNFSPAFRFGASDAKAGQPFAPECIFVTRNQQIQYALGFELVRGATEMTRQFTRAAKVATPVAEVVVVDTYATGRQDYTAGKYAPPSCEDGTYGDYLKGYNDAWAEATGRTSWQRAR